MILAFLGKGAYKILKLPFRMTSGLIFSLEKVFFIELCYINHLPKK